MISAEATTTFTPSWLEGQKDPPVFHLRTPGVIARAQMEAELAGQHQAGRVYSFELLVAVREGVLALLDGDEDQGRLLELIDTEVEQGTAQMTDDDRRLLAEVKKVLAVNWPAYRDLIAQIERRRELAPLVALRRFCVDIAGDGVTFTRAPDGMVSDATLLSIDPQVLLAAGNRAFALAYVSEEERGNFARPSSSGDGQPTSNSDDGSTEDGMSTGGDGKKTRASRSRRGSGRS